MHHAVTGVELPRLVNALRDDGINVEDDVLRWCDRITTANSMLLLCLSGFERSRSLSFGK